MKKKLLIQTGVCIGIILTTLLFNKLDISFVNKVINTAGEKISVNYTSDDIKNFADDAKEALMNVPSRFSAIILSSDEDAMYGEPLDTDIKSGETVAVYAVGGGTVVEVGEAEDIGKYIKIRHGEKGESVYGNCSEIYVKKLQKVKKGHIIASFVKKENKEFYYSFSQSDK